MMIDILYQRRNTCLQEYIFEVNCCIVYLTKMKQVADCFLWIYPVFRGIV